MTISDGYSTKELTLYPQALPTPYYDDSIWVDYEENGARPMLTIGRALTFKDETEDDCINSFISDPSVIFPNIHDELTHVLHTATQEQLSFD